MAILAMSKEPASDFWPKGQLPAQIDESALHSTVLTKRTLSRRAGERDAGGKRLLAKRSGEFDVYCNFGIKHRLSSFTSLVIFTKIVYVTAW